MSAGTNFEIEPPPDAGVSTEIFVLNKLRLAQRRDWESGSRRLVEFYLTDCPELAGQDELLLDFIYSEYCLREELDDRPAAEEYFQRFPQFADRLTRLFVVHSAVGAEEPPAERDDKFSRLFAAGEFEILEKIAEGGMGSVYLGRDLRLNREVAVKVARNDTNLDRFLTEAVVTARLPHPGIPPIYAFSKLSDGTPCLAMKLVHGRTLADLLRERPAPLDDLQRFVQIFEHIAQTVGFAHAQGVIHRDLKPRNVMVGEFGEVQVVDWGLAKELKPSAERIVHAAGSIPTGPDATCTVHGAVLGTPSYMAPEQARGEPVDCRTDVFALGAVLATILTGRPAFIGETPQEIIDKAAGAALEETRLRLLTCGADGELITLALRCMAHKPDERPADGRAVAELTANYRASITQRLKQTETRQVEAGVRETEERKRRNLILACAAIVIVVVLVRFGIGLQFYSLWRGAEEKRWIADVQLQDAVKTRTTAHTLLRNTLGEIESRFDDRTPSEADREFMRGMLKQLDAVTRAPTGPDAADGRALRADSWFCAAVLQHRLGDRSQADRNFDEALQEYQRLAGDFPERTDEFRAEREHIAAVRLWLQSESSATPRPKRPILKKLFPTRERGAKGN